METDYFKIWPNSVICISDFKSISYQLPRPEEAAWNLKVKVSLPRICRVKFIFFTCISGIPADCI